MEDTIRKIRDAGKVAGSFASTVERANRFKSMGVQYLTCQADGSLIRDAFEAVRQQIVS